MAHNRVHTFDAGNFESAVLRADRPVLVHFWASWCGPCRAVAPDIEQVARRFDGRTLVGKVDVDANPALAEQFGVLAIPTLAVFKGGVIVERMVGVAPEHALATLLERHVDEADNRPLHVRGLRDSRAVS